MEDNNQIKAVLFDFGGVLAEEGYKNGMAEIAAKNNAPVEPFLKYVFQVIYDIGYTLGKADGHSFWEIIRSKFGIQGTDAELSEELLSRFVPRPYMFDIVRSLRDMNVTVCILSDQTNWLDELNQRYDFFHLFDHVFNSYHMGITKKDESLFAKISQKLGLSPSETLFVDDYPHHIERARSQGLNAILFDGKETFFRTLNKFFPDLNIRG